MEDSHVTNTHTHTHKADCSVLRVINPLCGATELIIAGFNCFPALKVTSLAISLCFSQPRVSLVDVYECACVLEYALMMC